MTNLSQQVPVIRTNGPFDTSEDLSGAMKLDTESRVGMNKNIDTMISIFGHSDSVNGDNNLLFLHLLQPILDQMEASQILQ